MNWTDYVVIVLIVISAVAGAMRGLLREAVSLIAWLVAVWAAWTFAYMLEPHLGGALADPAVNPWAARVIIFFATLLVGEVLGAIIAHFVQLSIFSGTDRLMGFVFGLGRGAVAMGVLSIACHAVRLEHEAWYRGSLLLPYADKVGTMLRVLS